MWTDFYASAGNPVVTERPETQIILCSAADVCLMSTWKINDWKTFFCFIVNNFCVFVLQSGFLAVKTETNTTTVMKISSSSERWRLQTRSDLRSALWACGNTSTPSSRAGSSFTPRYSLRWMFPCTADFDAVVFQALWGRADPSSVHLTVLSFQGEKLSDVRHRRGTR